MLSDEGNSGSQNYIRTKGILSDSGQIQYSCGFFLILNRRHCARVFANLEPKARHMIDILSWQEIESRYSGEWVQLAHCEWPEGQPHPTKGSVLVSARDRMEFFHLVKETHESEINLPEAVQLADTTIVYVGEPTRLTGISYADRKVSCESNVSFTH